jgi:catechol-2,3-dioxygenase
MISPALHHVTLQTDQLDAMSAWYAKVVGARVMFRNPGAVWMTNDAANHRIAFLALPGVRADAQKSRHSGLHHFAFEYAGFADLMASYERLAGEGLQPVFCLDHGMTVSLYFQDPDGNFVELQCDCFGDWAQSSEWMTTSPDFAADPIGTFFDPAKVLDAHRRGAEFQALHKAMRGGEFLPHPLPKLGPPD